MQNKPLMNIMNFLFLSDEQDISFNWIISILCMIHFKGKGTNLKVVGPGNRVYPCLRVHATPGNRIEVFGD